MRLLYSPPHPGPLNMALDQALMESVGEGSSPPTLRLYAWTPPCLSLGYTQRWTEVDPARLQARAWEVVRRPTGGKAILHTDELTYSLIYPQNHPLVAGDILSSYRRLSQALLGMLAKLGLGAELAPPPSQDMGPAGPVCFEVPSAYEITAGGRKLIGSAQVRRQKAVLQHGSLPLSGDLGRICEVLVFPDEAARQKARQDVLNRATTLEKALGARVSWEQAAQALVEAYQDSFGEALHHGELSPPEAARAEGLRAEVYSQMSWTQKR